MCVEYDQVGVSVEVASVHEGCLGPVALGGEIDHPSGGPFLLHSFHHPALDGPQQLDVGGQQARQAGDEDQASEEVPQEGAVVDVDTHLALVQLTVGVRQAHKVAAVGQEHVAPEQSLLVVGDQLLQPGTQVGLGQGVTYFEEAQGLEGDGLHADGLRVVVVVAPVVVVLRQGAGAAGQACFLPV